MAAHAPPRRVTRSQARRRTKREKAVDVLTSVATGLNGLALIVPAQHGALAGTTRALALLCQISAKVVEFRS